LASLAVCSLPAFEKQEKVLDLQQQLKSTSVINNFLVLNQQLHTAPTGRKNNSIPAETRTNSHNILIKRQ